MKKNVEPSKVQERLLELVLRLDAAQKNHLKPLPVASKERSWYPEDSHRINAHYQNLFEKFPQDLSKAMDIGERNVQDEFFQDLIQIGDLNDQSVLDVGCGSGSLLSFLEKNGIQYKRYVGLDQSEDLLKEGKKNHAENKNRSVEFFVEECFGEDPLQNLFQYQEFDYILISGIFSLRPRNWSFEEYNGLIIRLLTHYLKYAKKGLAFNFVPSVYKPLLKVMAHKMDNEWIAYHPMDRLQVIEKFERLDIRVASLPANLMRTLMQYPLFLFPKTS